VTATAELRFRPMTEADLPLVREWLLRPHVRRWWDDGSEPDFPEGSIRERRMAIRSEDPTEHFIVELDARPIGDIQSYRTTDHPDYIAEIGIDEPAIGIDVYIGEPELIGRGLGPELIRRFLRDVAFPRYQVDLALIGPTRSNAAAIRAYEKAGYRFRKVYDEPDTREREHYLMELRRADIDA